MRILIPLAEGQHESRSEGVSSRLSVNWYPKLESKGSKVVRALYPTPGLLLLGAAAAGPCRGNGAVFNNKAYFVSGNRLISIDTSDTITTIGTLNTSFGRISMAAGRSHLAIVDGSSGYTWNDVTFAEISDGDFPTCDYIEWIDNYFVVSETNTNKFFISALDDATTWAALDFDTAENRPDILYRPLWFRKKLLLVGDETCELWWNSGNPDFPWENYNVLLEMGIAAPDSAVVTANTLYMLAKTKDGGYSVVKAKSESIQTISDSNMAWQITQMDTVSDAFGFVYEIAGHRFYQLTFPSANKTYAYDDTTNMWHERQSGTDRHRVSGHVFFNKKHIVGDRVNRNYYTLDVDTYTDNDETIHRIWRGRPINYKRFNLFHSRFEGEFEPGVGLVTGQGSNPQVMYRYSDDKTNTWSNEDWRSIGKIGEYDRRAIWRRKGESRERIPELKITDPVNAVLISAVADVEVGVD